jgi:hypothetical protein
LEEHFHYSEYPYLFAAMVIDKNAAAAAWMDGLYNLSWVPTTYYDGGYDVKVGGENYAYVLGHIMASGEREASDLGLKVTLNWLGKGEVEIQYTLAEEGYSTYVPEGTDVTARLGDEVSLTFDSVTQAGYVDVMVSSTGPVPSSFAAVPESAPAYYDIVTTALSEDAIEVCITYDDSEISPEDELLLTLQHHDGLEWTNITSLLDTEENIVCGTTTSLSTLAVGISSYTCGDANGSSTINMLDITYLISYLYRDGPAPEPEEAGDANGSGSVNMLDITYLIAYLYKGGPEPVCP